MTDFDYAINLKTKIDHGSAASEARQWASHFGGSMTDAFSQITNNAAAVFLGNALTAGFHKAMEGIREGVVGINAEMQKLEIGIATTFNVQTGKPFEDMLGKSREFVAQMRKDAAALPGEFSELVGIFRSAVSSGMDAGLSAEQIRRLSSNAMVAGKTLGLESDQVGRELSQLFQGRAGGHNVFGRGLGIDTNTMVDGKHFNEADASKRADFIEQKMAKFAPAIEYYEKTWDAQTSTMIDRGKQLLGNFTTPLFEELTKTLADLNAYMDANGSDWMEKAKQYGTTLAGWFRSAKETLLEWWPAVSTFFENMAQAFRDIWNANKDAIGGLLSGLGDLAKGLLSDPATIDKLIVLGQLWVGAKVGGGLVGSFGSALSDMNYAFGESGRAVGAFGEKAVLANDSLGGMIGSMDSSAASFASVIAKAGALALIFGSLTAVIGTLISAIGTIKADRRQTVGAWEKEFDGATGASLERSVGALNQFEQAQRKMAAWDNKGAEEMAAALEKKALDGSGGEALAARLAAQQIRAQLEGTSNSEDQKTFNELRTRLYSRQVETQSKELHAGGDMFEQMMKDRPLQYDLDRKAAKEEIRKAAKDLAQHAKKGGGNQVINKIEMTISSNQSPGQIARAVLDEVAKLRRRPVASPGVPGYGMT